MWTSLAFELQMLRQAVRAAARLGRSVAFAVPEEGGVQAIGASSINACCLPGGYWTRLLCVLPAVVCCGVLSSGGASCLAGSWVLRTGYRGGVTLGRAVLSEACVWIHGSTPSAAAKEGLEMLAG